MRREIALARPNITQAEIDAVTAVLRTPNLSLGPKLGEFERAFASYCGTAEAVACSSGTAALHLLMAAIGVGPNDEVITTPFSFIASANCILFENAKPVFVDIDARTWNIDPSLIEGAVTEHTRAIIAVDVFGQVADLDPILATARSHGLSVIEDSCEALGSRYKGRRAGGIADAGVFGFYPNKQITTGEGGMITTDNAEWASLMRSLRNQGRDDAGGWLSHSRLGYNYRLSEIPCALGLAQLNRIDEIIEARSTVADMYHRRLADEPRVQLQHVDPSVQMSHFVFVVRLADSYEGSYRDVVLRRLRGLGIGCSNYFAPIHLQPFYVDRFGYRRGDFPVCEALAERTLALPFHHELTEADVDDICKELAKCL